MRAALGATFAVLVLLARGVRRRRGERRAGDGDHGAGRHDRTTTTDGECANVEAPAPREDGGATQPTERLDPEKTWTLRFETSCGAFVVTLDTTAAPATAASLVSLAEQGYFDDTVFHRIVPGFVIQGGDPTQSGTRRARATRPSTRRRRAPATSRASSRWRRPQAEPAGTSGSQFFVVTGDDIGLPPDYAVVGEVTEGLDVVELIGTLGDPATEQPLQPIVIESVTASSS